MKKEYEDYMALKQPSKNDFITIYAYKAGEVAFAGTYDEWNKSEVKKNNPNITTEKVFNEDTYRATLKEYNQKRNELFDKWKKAIFENVGAELGKKEHEGLWNIVYRDNHSSLIEVENAFEEYFEAIFC